MLRLSLLRLKNMHYSTQCAVIFTLIIVFFVYLYIQNAYLTNHASQIDETIKLGLSTTTLHSTTLDPTFEERANTYRQEIRDTQGQGCVVVYSDGTPNLICTDKDSEREYYVKNCTDKQESGTYTLIDSLYATRDIDISTLREEDRKMHEEWKLIRNCIPTNGQYLNGIYHVSTKNVLYFSSSSVDELELYETIISGSHHDARSQYPLFLIQKTALGKGSVMTEIIDPNKPIHSPMGTFATVFPLYNRQDFQTIGTVFSLDAGIIMATEKGVVLFDYARNAGTVIVPVPEYGLFQFYNDGGDGHTDRLKKTGVNSFEYQIFDAESQPIGVPMQHTIAL